MLLLLMLVSMGLHHRLFAHQQSKQSLEAITQLTQHATLSYSQAYDESVYLSSYPEMPSLGRKGFVYGK